jgi:hypothetical protein
VVCSSDGHLDDSRPSLLWSVAATGADVMLPIAVVTSSSDGADFRLPIVVSIHTATGG